MIRIIVVDDEILARIGIQTFLEQEKDIEVKGVFGFGNDALEFLKSNTVDIVLTDIEMTELDGFSLTGLIRENNYAKGVIIISSHEKFEYARKALDVKADAYILKHELDSEFLINTIRETYEKVKTTEESQKILIDNISNNAGDLMYQIGVIKFLNVENKNGLPDDLQETMFKNLVENIIGKYQISTLIEPINQHKFIFFQFEKKIDEVEIRRHINEICVDVVENLELYLNKRVIIILSSPFSKVTNVRTHYSQVKELGSVFQYVDDNIMEKVSLNEAAEINGMSVATFCKKFKEHTGVTFNQYVNEQKINKVKKLVKGKNNSLAEIADMTGFTNENYMSRVFQKVTGKTISKWRKEIFE